MNRSLLKTVAQFVLASFLLQALAGPATSVLALTGGPTQPEFSSFEPVTTTNMVNPLTGQFTYNLPVINIPGPNGSGYAMSLSYHSGVSPEEEASWVGYGWTLNPGAITRTKRGLPDEFRGEKVKYWNKAPTNWTVTAGGSANAEAFSWQPLYAGVTLRYNSYKGFGYTAGLSMAVKGYASFGLNIDNGQGSFSYSVSPAPLLEKWYEGSIIKKAVDWVASSMHESGKKTLRIIAQRHYSYAQYSVANDIRPMYHTPYTGESINVKLEGLFDPPPTSFPLGTNLQIDGSYTYQKNVPEREVDSYGYMYSAEAGDEDIMDYYTEKGSTYERRDQFLGVPFSNADYFNVTGEGMGGGFRLHSRIPGHFHPNNINSYVASRSTNIIQPHLKAGKSGPCTYANLGLGAKVGVGFQKLSVGSWEPENNLFSFASLNEGDEPYFFRMNNDMGGEILFSDNDEAFGAEINGGGIWGFQSYDPDIPAGSLTVMNSGKRSGRSSHIAYTTFGDIRRIQRLWQTWPNTYDALDKNLSIYHTFGSPLRLDFLSTFNPDAKPVPDESIAEFSITAPTGSTYTYGLPVIEYGERQLTYGLKQGSYSLGNEGTSAYTYLTPNNAPVVIGEESETPYVSKYLLTAITAPDYVDRTHNGYSEDDFGGYVSFQYAFAENWDPSQIYFLKNDFYDWRIPYRGLRYNHASRSDSEDDVGSFSSGKRMMFYLSAVETKSHVAVFVTNKGASYEKESVVDERGAVQSVDGIGFEGSNEERKDGYEAVDDMREAAGNQNATTANDETNVQRQNHLRKLDRIELWSKDEKGDLKEKIQTVHFEYDYALCTGLPNSYDGAGKLTLRKVWFEYNGVVNAKISPYVFGYEYRSGNSHYSGLPSEVQSKYNHIINDPDYNGLSPAEQNPSYSPLHIGRWGNYQYDPALFSPGLKNRFEREIPWEHQNPDYTKYDPAAWNLKWIRLPSGGEIHVQYEPGDYSYVQDRPAMAMVNLSDFDFSTQRYYLDVSGSLGLMEVPDKMALKEAMYDLFVMQGEKMYFKILHSLDGGTASLDDDASEFVTGWVKVKDVGYDQNLEKLYIELYDDGHTTPSEVAKDFKKTSRRGKGMISIGNAEAIDPKSIVMSLLSLAGDVLVPNIFNDWEDGDEIKGEESWLRIPLGKPERIVKAKKGGGIRVKRLLMYDPGVEAGAGHLFGSEYLYETEAGQSSGVASNEPSEGREESALVRLLDKRKDQGWLTKAIAGEDREQFEGPIGESLLPAPAVSYSRVVVKNIHSGKTNPGFTIHEYFTTKDYPSQCIYGPADVDGTHVTEVKREHDFFHIPTPYFSYTRGNIWATQGYSFVLNNLNGQIRKVATYGGDYDNPEDWVESSSQEYSYYKPGEKIAMLSSYSVESEDWIYKDPGKEMEVVFEGRSIEDIAVNGSLSYDGSIAMLYCVPPMLLPIVAFIGTFSGNAEYNESKLRTHVTCKVIRYPAIVKNVVTRADGIESILENLAFNPLTGEPAVVQTKDGYSGLSLQHEQGTGGVHDRVYRTFTWPAALQYPEMGQKASNEGAEIISNADLMIDKRYDAEHHYLYFKYKSPGKACDASAFLCAGDLIRLYYPTNGKYDPNRSLGVYHVEAVSGNRVVIQPHSHSPKSYNESGVSIKILRSGKTNQLGVPRASITSYGPENP